MNKEFTVMVVEDEVLIRIHLVKKLEAYPCRVVAETGKGEDAVRLADEKRPQLMLLDVKLADAISGIEVYNRLRDKEIYFVIVSAYKNIINEIEDTGKLLGVYDKPISDDALLRIFNDLEKKVK